MTLEASLAVGLAFVVAGLIADWPRTIAGVIFGLLGRRLPYATIFMPTGSIVIGALGEFIYPMIGRTSEATLPSFAVGVLAAGAGACSTYVTLRNLRDRF